MVEAPSGVVEGEAPSGVVEGEGEESMKSLQ